MKKCMPMARCPHQSDITMTHSFDIRERISLYEKLCRSHRALLFKNHEGVRGWMDWLMDTLDSIEYPRCLRHTDVDVDSFLFFKDSNIKLLDWEYAGMCDLMIDVSICATYSYCNEEDTERLSRLYL